MPDLEVPSDVVKLAGQLADPKPMRRGSVTERYIRCNKAGCACCDSEDARHGPYYSVSRVVNGQTQSRWLGAEEAQIVRQQVEHGKPANVWTTSRATVPACGTRSSVLRDCAWAQELSKPVARLLSECDANGRECIGPLPALTRSSHSAAAN
jgi:hypothetical protein